MNYSRIFVIERKFGAERKWLPLGGAYCVFRAKRDAIFWMNEFSRNNNCGLYPGGRKLRVSEFNRKAA